MPLTKQEIFDAALNGVREQYYIRSMRVQGRCAYRGTDDRKCGLGHSMPDDIAEAADNYGVQGNQTTIRALLNPDNNFVLHQELCALYPESEVDFLESLQMAHDCMDPRNPADSYEQAMQSIAFTYCLAYTKPVRIML